MDAVDIQDSEICCKYLNTDLCRSIYVVLLTTLQDFTKFVIIILRLGEHIAFYDTFELCPELIYRIIYYLYYIAGKGH